MFVITMSGTDGGKRAERDLDEDDRLQPVVATASPRRVRNGVLGRGPVPTNVGPSSSTRSRRPDRPARRTRARAVAWSRYPAAPCEISAPLRRILIGGLVEFLDADPNVCVSAKYHAHWWGTRLANTSMSTGDLPSMLGMTVRSSPAPVMARIRDCSSSTPSTSTGDRESSSMPGADRTAHPRDGVRARRRRRRPRRPPAAV